MSETSNEKSFEDMRRENEVLIEKIRAYYVAAGQPAPVMWQEETRTYRTRAMTIRSRFAEGTRV